MNRGKVKLLKYTNEKAPEMTYEIRHDNGKTTLEKYLKIYKRGPSTVDGDPWHAEIILEEFPAQDTPQEAALKMADWLERIASVLRVSEFHDIKESQMIELDDEQ